MFKFALSWMRFVEPHSLCVINQWTCLLERQCLESMNKRFRTGNRFVSTLVSPTNIRILEYLCRICDINKIPLSLKETKSCIIFRLKLFIDCPPHALHRYLNHAVYIYIYIYMVLQFEQSYFP